MSGTTTSPTACYIDAYGIHAPDFNTIQSYLIGQYQAIYGADIYLGNDSQDGQLVGIFSAAINDNNALAVAVYNSFSPSTAQGVGLSSVVKINGITRQAPTNSTATILITGVAGTIISNGSVSDTSGNTWTLLTLVTIPFTGQISVTATCNTAGAILVQPNTINTIATPTYGWQTATNPAASTQGQPVETDAALRQRQTTSTMLPSVSASDGLIGAVSAVAGVARLAYYENDTSATDANGLPSHSIAFVVDGGSPQLIGAAIAAKKTPGCGTYGTTSVVVVDPYNVPHTYNYFVPTVVPITVTINITPLLGYNSNIGAAIVAAVIAYITGLAIGADVYLSRVIGVANLTGTTTQTFNINSILIARNGGTPAMQDIANAFNEASTADTTTVTLNV